MDRLKRPVPFPRRPLLNPTPQGVDFRRAQVLFRLWWRHEFVRVRGCDSSVKLALVGRARIDD